MKSRNTWLSGRWGQKDALLGSLGLSFFHWLHWSITWIFHPKYLKRRYVKRRYSSSKIEYEIRSGCCLQIHNYRERHCWPVSVALVVDEVRRILVGRPLYDSGLSLMALQRQRPLISTERLEFTRRLRRVLLPLAQPTGCRRLGSASSTPT